MTNEGAYQHAGGYNPMGLTARGFATFVALFGSLILVRMGLDRWLGYEAAKAVIDLLIGCGLLYQGIRGTREARRLARDGGERWEVRKEQAATAACLVFGVLIALFAMWNLFALGTAR